MSADSTKTLVISCMKGMTNYPTIFCRYKHSLSTNQNFMEVSFTGCVERCWQRSWPGSVPESHGGGAEVFAQPTSTAPGIQSLQRRWPEAAGDKRCKHHAGDFVQKVAGVGFFFFGWWFWMRGFQFIDRLMIPGFFGAELKRCWCWVALFFLMLAGSSPVLVAGTMMTASMRFVIGRMTTKSAWSTQVSTWYVSFFWSSASWLFLDAK